jgi:DNA recombination protein RmuC
MSSVTTINVLLIGLLIGLAIGAWATWGVLRARDQASAVRTTQTNTYSLATARSELAGLQVERDRLLARIDELTERGPGEPTDAKDHNPYQQPQPHV